MFGQFFRQLQVRVPGSSAVDLLELTACVRLICRICTQGFSQPRSGIYELGTTRFRERRDEDCY